MRVVAGELRGRRLVAPSGDVTRPTTDKVREAMFNALGSLHVVVGARAVDLFAGTGALGIEALSRGATHVTFVEANRHALRALRANVEALDLTARTTVVDADVRTALRRLDHQIGPTVGEFDDRDGGGRGRRRLVFADPPYGFDAWPDVFAALARWEPPPFVVVESGDVPVIPEPWELVRSRRYGRTWVAFSEIVAK